MIELSFRIRLGGRLGGNSFFAEFPFDVFLQCDRIVVFRVVRAVQERNTAMFRGLDDGFDRFRFFTQFPKIPLPEFAPFPGIMSKPLAQRQRSARRL